MELIPWFIRWVNRSRLYSLSPSDEKTRLWWLPRHVEERREGYRIAHKAESTLSKGGVSLAQSHKHNKHFQEPIILQESFERFELVAVEILKLPVASCTTVFGDIFLSFFHGFFWNKLEISFAKCFRADKSQESWCTINSDKQENKKFLKILTTKVAQAIVKG